MAGALDRQDGVAGPVATVPVLRHRGPGSTTPARGRDGRSQSGESGGDVIGSDAILLSEVGIMKLAEALALRAEARRRVEQLQARIVASARYQEGEEPAEDAGTLLVEAQETLEELQSLIRRVNRTNAAADLGADGTMTDALARRDVLRLEHSVLTAVADAASGKNSYRQLRSELRQLSALPVAELRATADGVARDLRELDVRVQRANWELDLLD